MTQAKPSGLSDHLGAETYSPLCGRSMQWVDSASLPTELPEGAVVVAVDFAGALPDIDLRRFDALVTTCRGAPRPWVSVAPERLAAQLDAVRARVAAAPIATAILARVLRIGEHLSFDEALEIESLAYSTLLGGGEFARWLAGRLPHAHAVEAAPVVRYERHGDIVTLTLAAPANHNAMTAGMRDALYEALANVLDDPTAPQLVLRGERRSFSTGRHLPEFGSARDLAQAHTIRSLRSCARLLNRLGERAEVRLQGACIGSGFEIPAAAARRIGAPDSFMQLPELRMGLIPGAGGTVSIARAIGRHRLFWLVLGSFRLGAEQARDWGLLHDIER